MNFLSPPNDLSLLEDDDQRKKRVTSSATTSASSIVGLRDSFRRPSGSTNESSNARKYAEYPTERLIALSRESADECKVIAKELNRRLAGTSVGYLNPSQLLTLCEHYASCRMLQRDDLTRLQSQLHSDIQQLTDQDPFEILSVPSEKLLHLAAVTLCLQNMSKYQ